MKKIVQIGIFILIAVFSITSFAMAEDNVEKAFGVISDALKMAKEHQYEKMVELCTEAIELDPNLSLGYLTRAKGYSALGQHEKARADKLKSIEITTNEVNETSDLAGKYKGKDTVVRGGKTTAGDTGYSVYFRPGVRFGTDDRTLYIMDLLVPFYQDDKNIVFGNIKYTPNNHDGWEINAGMGYRRLLWDDQLILGANAYYDRRKTDWGTDHEQWGVGLEAMTDIPLESFDLGLTARFNYYHPLSDTKIDGLGTEFASYVLSNTGIILNGGRVEEPMRGFDYELGMRIPYISDYIETWAYVGGYNYQGKLVDDINGFQVRLEVIPTDFIRLNYEFHHDNYSKAEHYGEVTLEVPFSIGNLVTGRNPFEEIGDMMTGSRELSARMVEPVRRDVDVKVVVDEDNDNIPGAGDQIENIVFVSETGVDAPGNGTKDNPYATISYALANNARILAGAVKTIHVMNSSDVAVVDEAAGGGLTLAIADFLLWGSGADHPKYSNIINMPYAGHPTINDTLELNAANLEVTGLGFDVAGIHGIEIQLGAGNSGMKITDNVFKVFSGTVAYGIGTPIIDIATPLGTEQNPIIIANNSFEIRSAAADAYGVYLRNTGAGNDIFASVSGNDMLTGIWGGNSAYGIYIGSMGGILGSAGRPAIVSGNRMIARADNLSAYGVSLYGYNGVFAAVTNNDMSGGIWANSLGAVGIRIASNNGDLGEETRPVIISGNRMTVKSDNLSATGIVLSAWFDLFAGISSNEMDVLADGDAYGAFLRSILGTIGTSTTPTLFRNNSGKIGFFGGNDSYLMELRGGVAGSYVDWTGNSINVFGGIWTGNYPATPGPVFLNGYGGTITP
jgi:Inverse autotransporter, beta-domain